MRAVSLFALLFLGRAAAAAEEDRRRSALDYGLWNHRIQTLYALGEDGKDALPLLVYSSDDADWQVRLTAVHFMGKLGPAAAPALGDIVRVEPCPLVRVSALRWLTGMGRAGEGVLREVMSPEDEREMESIPDRFGTERMGKPIIIDAPGGAMTAEFFDHGLDLRVCASSEYANRRKRMRGPESAPAEARPPAPAPAAREAPPAPDSFEPVVTPPVRAANTALARERLPDMPPSAPIALIDVRIPDPGPRETEKRPPEPERRTGEPERFPGPENAQARIEPSPPERDAREVPRRPPSAEIASVRAAGAPEVMPSAGPGFAPREAYEGSARFAAAPGPRALAASAPSSRPKLPPVESFPAAGPGLFHEPAPRGAAELVDDAGTGAPENDPVPELILRLAAAEPRTRARAADELGKRGRAALPAVPALRRALKDPDRRVRASAVLALGGAAGEVDGVAADLRRALRDRNEDVRFSAVIALRRLPAPSKPK